MKESSMLILISLGVCLAILLVGLPFLIEDQMNKQPSLSSFERGYADGINNTYGASLLPGTLYDGSAYREGFSTGIMVKNCDCSCRDVNLT